MNGGRINTPDAERVAHTEALFRELNERIAETSTRFDAGESSFVCECADRDCAHRVDATIEEYEEVRAEPTHFLLAPGHADPRIERVVRRRTAHEVVEKIEQRVAATVRRLDPRAEPA